MNICMNVHKYRNGSRKKNRGHYALLGEGRDVGSGLFLENNRNNDYDIISFYLRRGANA